MEQQLRGIALTECGNMTVTFTNGDKLEIQAATVKDDSLAVIPKIGSPEVFALTGIKSIMPDTSIAYKDRPESPTRLQTELMDYLLKRDNYQWDRQKSLAAAGALLKRVSDGDFWLFGMTGEIMHNPEALLTIKL
jgi:hypothetical protein